MILNLDWLKLKEKPYFHQISINCIEKLVECMEGIDIEEIDAATSSKIEKQILILNILIFQFSFYFLK